MAIQQVPLIAPSDARVSWRKLAETINQLIQLFGGSPGFTGTITTAKLTGGGANGSMTFSNGILTAQTPAT